jgi:hypothetical protein
MIRGPISLVIVGAIMLFGTVLVTLGPQKFEGYLPDQVIDLLDSGMAGTISSGGKGSGDTAADFLDDGADGLKALGPIAAMAGNKPVFIKDVVDGYTTRVANDMPAEIMLIRPISGCRLTAPLKGTVVGHVTSGSTGLDLPLRTYNDRDLAGAVQALVNDYRETGLTSAKVPYGLAYEAYDVAVTETSAPVYLVLENIRNNRIWNIHLAPGAQVERVVLLGGAYAGVANLDPVVPVEVLPGPALADCGIQPAYPLNPGHRFFAVLKDGPGSYKDQAEADFAAMQERIAAYNTWFRDTFGVLADETRAGFDDASVSVVGPQPGAAEPKAIYAPIKGSRIRMTQDVYFEIEGQVPEGEDFVGRVKAIATAFAFGDLTTLRQGVSF